MSDTTIEQIPGSGPEAAVSATDEQLVAMLVDRARSDGLRLTGEGGLLQQLTKGVLESALEGEITDHLGYDKHDVDGRFYLTYRAEVLLDAEDQGNAGARIRDDLEKRGYKITSFRDDAAADPAVVLEAYSPDKDFTIRVAGYQSLQVLNLAVFTPCLLPPGVKQEQM